MIEPDMSREYPNSGHSEINPPDFRMAVLQLRNPRYHNHSYQQMRAIPIFPCLEGALCITPGEGLFREHISGLGGTKGDIQVTGAHKKSKVSRTLHSGCEKAVKERVSCVSGLGIIFRGVQRSKIRRCVGGRVLP